MTAFVRQSPGGAWAHVVWVLVLSVAVCAPALGASAQGPWRALPWHLVDYHHRFPPTGVFRSVSIDMTLKGEAKRGQSLYLSPLWGKLGDTGFYFGFATDVSGPRGRGLIGKGVLFSRWGRGSKADVRAPKGGWTYVGDARTSGEGDYVSVRRGFKWGDGRYTFAMEVDAARSGAEGTWIDLRITEHRTGRVLDAGGLRFRGSGLSLQRTVVSFAEIFPPHGKGKWALPSRVPRLDLSFSPALVNNKFGPVSHRVHFPRRVPRLAQVRDDGFDLHVTLGRLPVPASVRALRAEKYKPKAKP